MTRVGLSLVRYAASARGGKPVVAIGGITLERAASVIAAGAPAVAVITDLLDRAIPRRRHARISRRSPRDRYNAPFCCA